MMKRCNWVTTDPIYIDYHDHEWGVPVHDDIKLFEMLLLEGAQAGLNWITILKKRERYRIAYDDFNPENIAKWNSYKIKQLLNDAGIVRNKLKIESAKSNAKAFLAIAGEYGNFDTFIWSFVNGKPIQNAWKRLSEVPSSTNESDRMSKELKQRGFKFVGTTICYAFMQAVGMVNDHLVTCFRYQQIRRNI